MDEILFTPETEVYIRNMLNPNKPCHGYIRDVITIEEHDVHPTYHQYDVRVNDNDTNLIGRRVSLNNILYAKCAGAWYTVKDIIKNAEIYCSIYKLLIVGKYYAPERHTLCIRDMAYEFEHDNADCELHNRAYHIKEINRVDLDSIRFDLSASYIREHKDDYFSTPSPSERLKKKLKRIEVNGEYMTAVWYDRPATVIKLSENDMYDTEKAYMWLLLKGLCENNKSECDRVLKLMESITYDIEKRRSNETDANTGRD